MTTGTSAPPIGSTNATPKTTASPAMTTRIQVSGDTHPTSAAEEAGSDQRVQELLPG